MEPVNDDNQLFVCVCVCVCVRVYVCVCIYMSLDIIPRTNPLFISLGQSVLQKFVNPIKVDTENV